MTYKIPTFLINLDRRKDRLKAITDELTDIDFTRISAVDGSTLSKEFVTEFISIDPIYQMSNNEIGCLLSHRSIWKKMDTCNISHAVVLEDDAECQPSLKTLINDNQWLPSEFDIIKLETRLEPIFVLKNKEIAKDRHLQELRSPHFGTAAYIVSLDGAKKLLELTKSPDRAVDDAMFELALQSYKKFKIYQMTPAPCVQKCLIIGTNDDSDIASAVKDLRTKKKISTRLKIIREIKRPYLQAVNFIKRIQQEKKIIPYS